MPVLMSQHKGMDAIRTVTARHGRIIKQKNLKHEVLK
jgi:hypothetical protein